MVAVHEYECGRCKMSIVSCKCDDLPNETVLEVEAKLAEVSYHTIEKWDYVRSGMFKIITDAWWVTDDLGNPLFYTKHSLPQCNQNKAIAERLANGRPLKQIPVVYVPLRVQDYMD